MCYFKNANLTAAELSQPYKLKVISGIHRAQEYSIPTHCPVNKVKNAIPVLADGSRNAIQGARTLI